MGCGESKHAIATENTISQSKRTSSKKSIEEKATTEDVLISNTKQEESGDVVAKSGAGNSVVKESDNAEKVSADGNVKVAEKVDQILEKQGEQSSKGDDVKESDDQPKRQSKVENVKDGDKEASPVAAIGDGNVKEAHKVDQILENQGDQNSKGDDMEENDDQPKGESVVEHVKEDGDKEGAPAAKSVLHEAKEGEEKKEVKKVKDESPIKSIEEGGAKEQEDAKLSQPDEAKTDSSGKKNDSDEVVKEKESKKEIEIDAKKEEALEDQKEAKETGEAEAVQPAVAKDSAHIADEKIPSAEEESEIESAEAGKRAD